MKNNIFDLINNSSSIVILTHENPDGDAIGSSLALYNYLSYINKTVDIIIPKYPNLFDFLPSINNIVDNSEKKYDLGIVVDTSTKERIGQISNVFSNCKKTIVIDHHISNTKFADINYINADASSCCEVLYYLFKDEKIDISVDIGNCIICGVITDTNGFKNNNVSYFTFKLVMELKKINVDFYQIYKKVLSNKTIAQFKLNKLVFNKLELLENGKIAYVEITQEELKNCDAKLGDHEGLVEIGRDIEGVEVSIFIREENDHLYVSLRSNGKIDVNSIANKIGGGGHVMAAGAKIGGNFKETKEILISEIKKVL